MPAFAPVDRPPAPVEGPDWLSPACDAAGLLVDDEELMSDDVEAVDEALIEDVVEVVEVGS